jgi:hypothetical protein
LTLCARPWATQIKGWHIPNFVLKIDRFIASRRGRRGQP